MKLGKIELKRVVDPPGPKAQDILKRDKEVLAPYNRPFYYPFVCESGKGVILTDIDGNEYIDFNCGLGVMSIGHANMDVAKAVYQQMQRLVHYSYTDFYYRYAVELAEKLTKITPGKYPKKVFFSGSGAESVEAFAKIARWHTKKPFFIAFTGAFHGRSMGAIAFTASSPVQKAGFFPYMPGVEHVPYAYCYRCPFHLEFPQCDYWCVDFIDDWLLKKYVPPEEVAAFFIEPIQGEGGIIVPPKDYHRRLKKLADKYGILYGVDEVQSGMGKTGKWFAIENFGVVPDILTSSKAIAGGISLGATVCRADVLDLPAGSHCTTLGGTPVACAASLATIKVYEKQKLLQNATRLGPHLTKRLKEMMEESKIIGDVRGIGLFQCFEVVKDKKSKTPMPKEAKMIITKAWKKGVVAVTAGESSVRVMPPLIITKDQLDAGVDALQAAVKEMEKELK
ncbi:MAG: acetyl ornithine aminotransferase family protein [Thermoplasmata archaeon]